MFSGVLIASICSVDVARAAVQALDSCGAGMELLV